MRNLVKTIKLDKYKNKVYVFSPAGKHTGGPELMHQLASELRENGVDAYMCYYPSIHPFPVHKNYKKYNVPFVRFVPDIEESVVVMPEVQIPRALKFKRAKLCIWWLSVNNFFVAEKNYQEENFWMRFLKFGTVTRSCSWSDVFNQNFFHLVQSYYAGEFLRSKGISEYLYLSDYLSPVFLREKLTLKKEDIVCYNPKKGVDYTTQIISASPEIKFIPLINMTQEEMKTTLARAKVYIDFGEHPGKDRIPREAAFLGACVLVGKRGSAENEKDVPIPEEFKFDALNFNPTLVVKKIKDCFSNYEKIQNSFTNYVVKISDEQSKFKIDVKNVFNL